MLISIPCSILTYWGIGLFDKSPWYLFLMLAFIVTYFVLYLNVYWLIVLFSIAPYRKNAFPGKVNKWNLLNVRMVASFCVLLNGILVKRKGFKNMPKKPCLIIFNHVSDFDPWIMFKVMGGRYAFVGKYALRKIPMVRSLASSIGTLYVDDNNPELNRKMVDDAVFYITQKKTSVAIAPEGTRNTTGRIMPFKHGGFNIATRSKCPIALVGFKGMNEAIRKGKSRPSKVQIELFDVIQPEEYKEKTAGELATLCENKYMKYFGER